jgi:2-keto-4-pentenoate hydratase
MSNGNFVERLVAARTAPHQIDDLPTELLPTSVAAGYDVTAAVAKGLGWEPLGWKIAGTTAEVREKLRIDEPIYGGPISDFG